MRPRLLDLFCGAGGAAMGYYRAGFDVVGVDVVPQPSYPFDFIQADAMTFPLDGFDAIHASPPCHEHSKVLQRNRLRKGAHNTGWMLEATIDRLRPLEVPWVVENVEGAQFPDVPHKVRLCGPSFGLDLRRHRWFASNVDLQALPCDHAWQTPRFRSLNRNKTTPATVIGVHGNINYKGELELRKHAMGIGWMNNKELVLSIPPVYTEFLGKQLL